MAIIRIALAAAIVMDAAEFRDLVYARTSQKDLALGLYIPEETPRPPRAVWVHGGGWRTGSRANPPALYLTSRGYAVASISYRLSQQAL